MQLRAGYELVYRFQQPTPIILVVNIHYTRAADLMVPDRLVADPFLPITGYRDGFGNYCQRVLAPPGVLRLTTDCVIRDSGLRQAFGQRGALRGYPESSSSSVHRGILRWSK